MLWIVEFGSKMLIPFLAEARSEEGTGMARWRARLLTGLVAATFCAAAQVAGAAGNVASAQSNGVGLEPAMGWSTWSCC